MITPHHGAGADVSIEDVAVLATLLADPSLPGPEDIEAVFTTYDESRRPRTRWLVQRAGTPPTRMSGEMSRSGRITGGSGRDHKEAGHHLGPGLGGISRIGEVSLKKRLDGWLR